MMKNLRSKYCLANTGYSIRSKEKDDREQTCSAGDGEEFYLSGKWSVEEHANFILGVVKFGNDWREIQKLISTRSCAQARSHAQKFFFKLKKMRENFILDGDIYSVKSLHEYAKTVDKDQLESLIRSMTEAHLNSEGISLADLNPKTVKHIENLCRSSSDWIPKQEVSQSETAIFEQYPGLFSFSKFCDNSLWRLDSADEVFNLPKTNQHNGKPLFDLYPEESEEFNYQKSELFHKCLLKHQPKFKRSFLRRKRLRFIRMKKPLPLLYKPKNRISDISTVNSTTRGRRDSLQTIQTQMSFAVNQEEEGTTLNSSNFYFNYENFNNNEIFYYGEEKEEKNQLNEAEDIQAEVVKDLFNYENETVIKYLTRD